jgi:hypothetical protein
MKMVKSLILGSAAGLVAMSGAQAADLPLKAKAVEYVRICSLYGAGFFYIPGTDTCIKLGGYLRVDTTFNGSGPYDDPAWTGNSGQQNRLRNQYVARSRSDLNIDTRTATEYGVVRTYFDAVFQWTSGTDGVAGGGSSTGIYFAFIQFAGFTFGKAQSQFDAPWGGTPGNNSSYLIGGYDDLTGINQLAYTASFGNGVSASVSLEDNSAYLQSQLGNVTANTPSSYAQGLLGTNSYGGTAAPDIVGQVRVDQAWGLFQASVAAHDIHASYYIPTLETSGHPGDAWGWAGQLALSIKNIPTGAGDSFNITAGYANGASRYIIGGVTPAALGFSMYSGTGLAGAYQSIGMGGTGDGVFTNGGSIQKSKEWGVRGAFTHNWNAYWNSSLFGSYSAVDWGGAGSIICTAAVQAAISGVCNPNFNIAQVGGITRWTPVKNLTFSGEVMYNWLDQKNTGTITLPAIGTKPAAVYELKNQGTLVGSVRVQRTF